MFTGVFTALVTPFKDGEVDFDSLGKLVDDQLNNGIQGLVVCGTTGESATLTEEEQFKVLDFVCKKVDKKVPLIFGSGSNNTAKTISLSKKACEYPIDGLLVVVPYYNKPPQEGMMAHFTAVADEVSKPVVLYNVPGRTVAALEPASIIELAKHKNIVAIKEANDDLNNFSQYKDKVPSDFTLLSGDDGSCVDFCLQGGHGVISVCSHVAPSQMVSFVSRARENDSSVSEEFKGQQDWINSLYITANPIPVKAALCKKGILDNKEMRLPLVAMNDTQEAEMLTALQKFEGLL